MHLPQPPQPGVTLKHEVVEKRDSSGRAEGTDLRMHGLGKRKVLKKKTREPEKRIKLLTRSLGR